MPRPSLGRTILSVRITPECRKALGEKPSEQASDVLERWAKTTSASGGEPAEADEGRAGSNPTSGQPHADSGADEGPDTRR